MTKRNRPVYEGDRLRESLVVQGCELGELCRRTVGYHGEPVGPEPETDSPMSFPQLLKRINQQDLHDANVLLLQAADVALDRNQHRAEPRTSFESGRKAYKYHLIAAKRKTKKALDKFAKALKRAARS